MRARTFTLTEDFNKRSPKSPLKSPQSPSFSSLRSLSSSSSGPKSSLGGAIDLSELCKLIIVLTFNYRKLLPLCVFDVVHTFDLFSDYKVC